MSELLLKQILEELRGLKNGQDSLSNRMYAVESELQNTRTDVSGLQAELQNTRADFSSLQAELQSTRSDVNSIQVELQSTRSDVNSIQVELQSTRSEMKSRFDIVDTKMSIIQKDVTEIKESVHRLEADQPEDVLGLLKSVNNKLEKQKN